MRLNEGLFEDSALYEIKGYYDSNFRGLEASDVAYDLEDAFEIAWEYLSNGDYVEIVDTDTGKRIVWEPDMLDEFDGEFPYDNMAKLMQKSVERNMGESMSRRPRRALKESLPKEKRGKFFTAITRAIQGVLIDFGLDEEAILHPELAPSKEDIELALEIFKKNYFNTFYKESLTNKSRRAIKESLPKGKKGRFFTDMYNAIADIIFKYSISSWEEGNEGDSEPSREDIESALDMFKRKFFESDYYKESFRGKPRNQRRTANESIRKSGRKLNKPMAEDLEPEAIDEPEKAEITWVDDYGEQKVSTVELINKSFPETALKFSKEHNDCSIINCTAPLKGAQREDEPEKVALTESEETDGLANLISNEINGEFETTNGYRNLRQAASEVAPDMLPVIDDIMDEENTHVGQLQTLLSMVDDSADNIDVGAEEAEDQLEDEDVEIEHNDEIDVDFAEIKKSDDEDADLEVKDDFDFDDEPFDEE